MVEGCDHAIVIGAGIGGLLTARVLSEAYERVTVLERDALPAIGEHRKGVPQDRHVHLLLPRGAEILDDLFTGLTAQLADAGAHTSDLFTEARFSPAGHLMARSSTGVRVLHASRPFLEGHVRHRVLHLSNVQLLERCDAVGLAMNGDRSRVTGARVIRRAHGSAEEVLEADVVVDATGRTSRTSAWLEALGYPPPDEEALRVGIGYASCQLSLDPSALGGDKLIGVGAEPGRARGMALSAIEGNRWILTLFGYGADRPPADPTGFWSFAAKVVPADVYEVVRQVEPLTPIASYRFDSNVRRRWERVRRFPDGLLVTGDALCSFNPVYGQGMTVAALEAQLLRRCLFTRNNGSLAHRFFRSEARAIVPAWKMAVGADLALPEVDGHRSLEVRTVNAYMRRLLAAAEHDAAVATAFIRVTGLLDPVPRLLRPAIALRVLARGGVRGSPLQGTRPDAGRPARRSSRRSVEVPSRPVPEAVSPPATSLPKQ